METHDSFHDAFGHRISSILTAPDGGTERIAVLCHGFLSSKTSSTNNTVTRMLIERGIATFRFDFFGQGDSSGPFEEITTTLAIGQTLAALDHVTRKGYRRIGLMGSSFGGLVSILTAAQRTDLACLALKCPVVDFAEELQLEFGQEELARWQATNTIPNIMGGPDRIALRYAFYEDCLRQIAYEPARSITAPTVIVQGDQDEHVPLHQSRRLYDALHVKKYLELLPGADHQFTKREDFTRMTTIIADWLTEHLTE
ncbi:MAG: alpha/beta fold hydrolase [Nitrospira sp.]|nr:alpha/beta fold hydrolase [Nitrospira sp.]MBH0187225.1 alpha/beta fold hydrolase [Nitrospira sp.]